MRPKKRGLRHLLHAYSIYYIYILYVPGYTGTINRTHTHVSDVQLLTVNCQLCFFLKFLFRITGIARTLLVGLRVVAVLLLVVAVVAVPKGSPKGRRLPKSNTSPKGVTAAAAKGDRVAGAAAKRVQRCRAPGKRERTGRQDTVAVVVELSEKYMCVIV